jgi:hypothetical protein
MNASIESRRHGIYKGYGYSFRGIGNGGVRYGPQEILLTEGMWHGWVGLISDVITVLVVLDILSGIICI